MYRKDSVMGKISALGIFEDAVFPIERWNAARSAASVLKGIYGAVFYTHRVPGEDIIIVTRVA